VTGPDLQEKQQYLEVCVVWAASMRLLGQFRSLKSQFFFKLLLILDVCTRSSNVYGNPSVGIATKARCYANCLTQVRQPFNILSQQATASSLSALNRISSFFSSSKRLLCGFKCNSFKYNPMLLIFISIAEL